MNEMSVTLAKWSLDEYHRMIAAGAFADRNVQLVLGEIVEMAPEGPLHRYTNAGVLDYLRQLLGDRALVLPPGPIELPKSNSEPEPDVSIVAPLGTTYRDRLPLPTDIYWLVEISHSTVNYDLNTKAKMYALDGVREYWVMDIERRQLWIHRQPIEGVYTFRQMQDRGTISPETFPDLEIVMEQLFV